MFPRMHVSIYVKDLNRSVEFYRRWWNREPEKVRPGYAKFHLPSPGLVFSMVENAERVAGNFGHLGIQVESQSVLGEWMTGAKAAGFELKEEIGVNCCYAVQDKFWVADPDGVQWEVYYFHEDAEFNDPRYSAMESTAGANDSAGACCATSFSVDNLRKDDSRTREQPAETLARACEPGSGCC